MMTASDIQAHARKLYETMGPKAIAEASQRARSFEQDGRDEDAQTWRRIEAALTLLQGPRAS